VKLKTTGWGLGRPPSTRVPRREAPRVRKRCRPRQCGRKSHALGTSPGKTIKQRHLTWGGKKGDADFQGRSRLSGRKRKLLSTGPRAGSGKQKYSTGEGEGRGRLSLGMYRLTKGTELHLERLDGSKILFHNTVPGRQTRFSYSEEASCQGEKKKSGSGPYFFRMSRRLQRRRGASEKGGYSLERKVVYH